VRDVGCAPESVFAGINTSNSAGAQFVDEPIAIREAISVAEDPIANEINTRKVKLY
jgi:hypothetical protein